MISRVEYIYWQIMKTCYNMVKHMYSCAFLSRDLLQIINYSSHHSPFFNLT